MKHIIDTALFDRAALEALFEKTDLMRRNPGTPLTGKILATLFYEPSTRTRLSFEAAMLKLGGQVITTENAKEFSSAAKGETIEDTVRVVGAYADALVIRHPEEGTLARAAAASPVPVINAGDGAGQHPTQALLDLYTIRTEAGGIEDKIIAILGDLHYGRAARSLAYLLAEYPGVRLILASPEGLAMNEDITSRLREKGIQYEETTDIAYALAQADVAYQTRIQKERFSDEAEYLRFKGSFNITADLAAQMKSDAIILHPLPRVDEISPAVDVLPQARYFTQAHYGLFVRMALLTSMLT